LQFFLGWIYGLQKNKRIFCTVCWADFFYKFIFFALALEAV